MLFNKLHTVILNMNFKVAAVLKKKKHTLSFKNIYIFLKNNSFFFSKDILNCSKVMVKTFIMLKKDG